MALERVVWRACRDTSKLLTCRERVVKFQFWRRGFCLEGKDGVMKSFYNGSENDFAVKWFGD